MGFEVMPLRTKFLQNYMLVASWLSHPVAMNVTLDDEQSLWGALRDLVGSPNQAPRDTDRQNIPDMGPSRSSQRQPYVTGDTGCDNTTHASALGRPVPKTARLQFATRIPMEEARSGRQPSGRSNSPTLNFTPWAVSLPSYISYLGITSPA